MPFEPINSVAATVSATTTTTSLPSTSVSYLPFSDFFYTPPNEQGPSYTFPPECYGNCDIKAERAQVIYWPTPAPQPPITSLVDNKGFTFISPSVYVAFEELSAYNNCGGFGDRFNTTLAFDEHEISTAFLVSAPSTAGDISYKALTSSAPYNFADLPESCSTVLSPAPGGSLDPCFPSLILPEKITTVQSILSRCKVVGEYFVYDPPSAVVSVTSFPGFTPLAESSPTTAATPRNSAIPFSLPQSTIIVPTTTRSSTPPDSVQPPLASSVSHVASPATSLAASSVPSLTPDPQTSQSIPEAGSIPSPATDPSKLPITGIPTLTTRSPTQTTSETPSVLPTITNDPGVSHTSITTPLPKSIIPGQISTVDPTGISIPATHPPIASSGATADGISLPPASSSLIGSSKSEASLDQTLGVLATSGGSLAVTSTNLMNDGTTLTPEGPTLTIIKTPLSLGTSDATYGSVTEKSFPISPVTTSAPGGGLGALIMSGFDANGGVSPTSTSTTVLGNSTGSAPAAFTSIARKGKDMYRYPVFLMFLITYAVGSGLSVVR